MRGAPHGADGRLHHLSSPDIQTLNPTLNPNAQNASEFQTWKSRPQLIHMQYAMLNEASGASNDPRLAKWQSIVVRARCSPPLVDCTPSG